MTETGDVLGKGRHGGSKGDEAGTPHTGLRYFRLWRRRTISVARRSYWRGITWIILYSGTHCESALHYRRLFGAAMEERGWFRQDKVRSPGSFGFTQDASQYDAAVKLPVRGRTRWGGTARERRKFLSDSFCMLCNNSCHNI